MSSHNREPSYYKTPEQFRSTRRRRLTAAVAGVAVVAAAGAGLKLAHGSAEAPKAAVMAGTPKDLANAYAGRIDIGKVEVAGSRIIAFFDGNVDHNATVAAKISYGKPIAVRESFGDGGAPPSAPTEMKWVDSAHQTASLAVNELPNHEDIYDVDFPVSTVDSEGETARAWITSEKLDIARSPHGRLTVKILPPSSNYPQVLTTPPNGLPSQQPQPESSSLPSNSEAPGGD